MTRIRMLIQMIKKVKMNKTTRQIVGLLFRMGKQLSFTTLLQRSWK